MRPESLIAAMGPLPGWLYPVTSNTGARKEQKVSSRSNYNVARTPLLLLAIGEALILYSSVYVAAIIVFGDLTRGEEMLGPLAPKAISIALVMLLSLISMGLYQFHQRMFFHEVFVRILVAVVIGSLGLAVIFYAIPSVMMARELSALSVLYALTLLIALRFIFIQIVDTNIFRRKTLVYGAGERANAIGDLRRQADRRGFQVVGSVPAPGDSIISNKNGRLFDNTPILELALEKGADEIVVAMDDRRGNLPVRELLDCKLRGIDVIDLQEFLERESGKIRIDLVHPGWLIFSPGFRITWVRRLTKRLFDLMFATIALLASLPVLLLVTLAVKIEDGLRAPVLYRQRRVGYHGDVFELLKFRSMQVDAEANGEAVWAKANDDRITRVGRFLRKSRFDEIPQLINVLRSQMSLIGPRPERPEFVSGLSESIPYYAERHTVKPGLTGWAQLRYPYGASEEDAIEKLQYDLYYVKNQSLLLDLVILLQTIEVVVWGKGAR